MPTLAEPSRQAPSAVLSTHTHNPGGTHRGTERLGESPGATRRRWRRPGGHQAIWRQPVPETLPPSLQHLKMLSQGHAGKGAR